ncbi:MAG: TIGR00296 family protein [Nitrososphaeria archaeon]|nr:TIGR00296 family protein [Nitrososphaeria archaeon]
MNLSDDDGKILVELARKAIEEYVVNGRKYVPSEDIKRRFSEKAGVFVTINRVVGEERELRGCIGFPEAILPLYEAVIEAAIAAATEDPRFEPLKKSEVDKILIEVSVLTPLELIKVDSPLQYPERIKVGEDGLMLRWRWGSGLLLPQVAVEYGWDAREFLENLCLKAGITPDSWLRKDVKIYKFQCLIWEEKGNGEIVRKHLGERW